MKEIIKISEKNEETIKTIMPFSCLILTIILSSGYNLFYILIGALLSFIAMFIIIDKMPIKELNFKKTIIAILIGCFIMSFFLQFSKGRILNISNCINKIVKLKCTYNFLYAILGILALPSLALFIYLFVDKIIPKVISFLKNLTIVEKKYLTIMTVIGIFTSVIITNITTVFSKPVTNGMIVGYDVIYTTDSGFLLYNDTFFNVSCLENDIRQPLFGVFAMPFAVIAKAVSQFIFFTPVEYRYETVITIIQFILTTITTIMIGRLLDLEEKDKKYLYLLFSISFPYLLFNLVIEQYVISLFYLILTLYFFYKTNETNYAYIGAAGTLLTSGVLLPFIIRAKKVKHKVIEIFKIFISGITIFIISGQFPQIMAIKDKMMLLTDYAVGKTFNEKLIQFSNFIKGIFISSEGEVVNNTYKLIEIENLSIIGVIIFVVLIISAIINRKEKMAKTSLLWICFSLIILLIIGWGTIENGLILYSLYFAWAYLVLLYLLLKKIFKNRKLFVCAISLIVLIMAIFNVSELLNIIIFGIKYY